ncbi:hypothetical protein [Paenibacillus hexagrammi]|uniref:Uncharacterized protein n=1 Tax=Paenibacillus hexagrammi TaxID=2908839 RepID=A0ABY3SJM1_9BACL|nr:hypothetical protein [Paenibacillus sp. YPD9-1]UJF34223.1 hypothetical protein L0M14_03045 [Paenibacillus sp. YPD9-1]
MMMKIQFDAQQLELLRQQFGTGADLQEVELNEINGGLSLTDISKLTSMLVGEEGCTYPKPGPIMTTMALGEEGSPWYTV